MQNSNNKISEILLKDLDDNCANIAKFIDRNGRFLVKIDLRKENNINEKTVLDYGRIFFSDEYCAPSKVKEILEEINETNTKFYYKDSPDNVRGILSIPPTTQNYRAFSILNKNIFPGQKDDIFGIWSEQPLKIIFYKFNINPDLEEEPLLKEDLKFFSDIKSAFWNLMSFNHTSDFLSGILYIIPLSINWFKKVELFFKTVNFELTKPTSDELICIYYRNRNESITDTFRYKNSYPLKFKPDYMNVILINKKYEQLDNRHWYKERGYRSDEQINYKYSKEAILELLEEKENESIEFKAFCSLDGLDEKLMIDLFKTIVSFANKNGGIILLGVEENNGDFKIEKGYLNRKTTNQTREQINHLIKDHCNPYIDFYSDIVSVDNKKILIIEISKDEQKPYQLKFRINNGYYIRRDSSDYEATREELIDLCCRDKDKLIDTY